MPPPLDRFDGRGYLDAFEGPATVKCIRLNLLQPIAENHSCKKTILECPPPLDRFDGRGYLDAIKGICNLTMRTSQSPSEPIVENRSPQLHAIERMINLDGPRRNDRP